MEIIFDNPSLILKSEFITVLSGDKTKELIPESLMGFKKLSVGQISLLDRVITKETKDFRFFQSQIGYVFLNPEEFLTNKTIKEEIAFGLKYYGFNQINKRINDALDLVDLNESFLNKKSLEVDLNIQKKVMLAAVLAIEPKILILNYIEHGLNIKEQKALKKLLKNLRKMKNMFIIIVSNNSNFFFDIADRIIVLNDNKVLFDDDEELFYKDKSNKYLNTPPIIEFIKIALNRNIKLDKTNDIKELMKDIYRKVNEKR